MTIIAFHSYRGGTGKSTLIANFAALLALKGKHIGLLDLDLISPGLGVLFNVDVRKKKCTLNDLLLEKRRLRDAILDLTPKVRGNAGKLYLIPASFNSEDIFRLLRDGYNAQDCIDTIQSFKEEYNLEILFIDTHPGFEEDTLLALASTDLLTIVLRADYQDFIGAKIAVEVGKKLRKDVSLLINMVPYHILNNKKIYSFIDRIKKSFEAPIMGVIPFYNEVLASMSKGIFALNHPDHSFTLIIDKITSRFAGG